MPDPQLKTMIDNKEFVLAPGVFELISALVADRMGFSALYVTGYGTVASYLGVPDAGIATYRDMLERIGTICARTTTPVIADADTGYGGLLNVRTTVQGYEAAGVSAMQMEDQEFPKKCGHTPFRRVIPLEDMQRKIEVAVSARRSDDFLLIARTDSRTGHGIEEAIRRAKGMREAGADVIFVESPESEEEMLQVASEVDAPLFANMVPGGRTPILPADRLADMGYAIGIHPAVGFLASASALTQAYADLKDNGLSTDAAGLMDFSEMNDLMGFQDIWAFEKTWAQE